MKGFCGVDPYSGDIYNALGTGGIPSYILSGTNLSITDFTESAVKSDIERAVKTFFETPVYANIAFEMGIQGTTMNITTTTKVFKAISSGKVYVGVNIVENKVSHMYNGQATITDRFQRTVGGEKTSVGNGYLWMDKVFTGPVSVGTTADRSFSIVLNDNWIEANIDVVACVWLVDGTSVSTLSCEDMHSVVSVQKNSGSKINIPVLIEKQNNNLVIMHSENSSVVKNVSLYNSSGKRVFNKDVTRNSREFIIPLRPFTKGVYVALCLGDNRTYSKKIVIH